MKTVALISGGKDSCFNMLQCVAEGHQIVALANLRPAKDKDELDSYMYQTVGHHAIDLYADAMELPLYRHTIQGTSLSTGRDYVPQEADEVEDLYQLLTKIKKDIDIEAVAVGAILSDYQRVRVENVCLRLGLTPLAYLWRRDQAPLLQEMVDCGMEAIIIKVAAMGLEPERHLGLSLREIHSHMLKMQNMYGLNVCGEGGEYETFTLDCPLFHKKIVVDESEKIIHSADAFAPVGYIHFKKLHLEDKEDNRPIKERVTSLPLTTCLMQMEMLKSEINCTDLDISSFPALNIQSTRPLGDAVHPCSRITANYFSVGGIMATRTGDVNTDTTTSMEQLKGTVEALGRSMSDLFSVCLYVQHMSDFAAINAVYKTYFGINPPVRVCVEAYLPPDVLFLLDCQGWKNIGGGDDCSADRRTMHVQGISHWAPANIGPYSQATVVAGRVFISGQIALVPGSMQLVSGGAAVQCHLSLQHALSVLEAMCPSRSIDDVLLCVCYVTHPDIIPVAKRQLKEICAKEQDEMCTDQETSHLSVVEYVVVHSLPRHACVEWQVYASCERPHVKDCESTHVQGNWRVHTRSLYSADDYTFFTSSTHVYFEAELQDDLDAEAAVTACIKCYLKALDQMQKSWSDIPLLRVFFPAHLYSFKIFSEAWRQGLESVSNSTITVSLVPVIQLAHRKLTMIVCH